MFGHIIVLLASIVNASNQTKRVFLTNQKCEVQPTFITIHYCPFAVKLDKCVGSCNTLI